MPSVQSGSGSSDLLPHASCMPWKSCWEVERGPHVLTWTLVTWWGCSNWCHFLCKQSCCLEMWAPGPYTEYRDLDSLGNPTSPWYWNFRIAKSPVRCIQLGHSRNIYCLPSLDSPQGLVIMFLKSAGDFSSYWNGRRIWDANLCHKTSSKIWALGHLCHAARLAGHLGKIKSCHMNQCWFLCLTSYVILAFAILNRRRKKLSVKYPMIQISFLEYKCIPISRVALDLYPCGKELQQLWKSFSTENIDGLPAVSLG